MSNWQEQQKRVATGVTDGSRKTPQTEALKLALAALEKVVAGWTTAFAEYKYDSDIPSENQYRDEVFAAIAAIKEALAQPEQERCVGCEACIDTACGRDECPKGWSKAAQPEQEPAFHGFMDEQQCCVNICYTPWAAGGPNNKLPTAYYTAPPKHTWVGLTGFEQKELMAMNARDAVFATEAKLKEKNA